MAVVSPTQEGSRIGQKAETEDIGSISALPLGRAPRRLATRQGRRADCAAGGPNIIPVVGKL